MAFGPDSDSLLTIGRDVNLWSIRTRKKTWRLHPLKHPSQVAFSPVHAANVSVLNRANGQIIHTEKLPFACHAAFSTDGAFMAIGAWGTGFVEALAPTPHK